VCNASSGRAFSCAGSRGRNGDGHLPHGVHDGKCQARRCARRGLAGLLASGANAGVRTGSKQRYTLTVAENVGTGFLTAPALRGTADPEVVHFR
jgi:hypothetical protein